MRAFLAFSTKLCWHTDSLAHENGVARATALALQKWGGKGQVWGAGSPTNMCKLLLCRNLVSTHSPGCAYRGTHLKQALRHFAPMPILSRMPFFLSD